MRWRARTGANFAAAFAEREDLAGIEQTSGIEGVVDAAHEVEIGVGEKKRHQLGLFHADAVFGGERAPASAWKRDRNSTRLNSSHRCTSYAVFCLTKKTGRNGESDSTSGRGPAPGPLHA